MFEKIVISIVVAIVLPLAAYVLTLFADYLKRQAAEIENDKIRALVIDAIDRVQIAVCYVAQTYTDSLKKESKFDKDAQLEALRKAKERAYELIDAEMQSVVEKKYGDFDIWLETVIEQTVRDIK